MPNHTGCRIDRCGNTMCGKATVRKHTRRTSLRMFEFVSFLHDDDKVVYGNQVAHTHVARVSFNTPGSRVDRELTAEMNVDLAKKEARFDLKTPWKKANINGAVVNQDDLKRVLLTATIDETIEYSMRAEVAIEEKKNEIKYTPSLRAVVPGREPITLDGTVTYLKAKKLDVNMALKNAFTDPVTFSGKKAEYMLREGIHCEIFTRTSHHLMSRPYLMSQCLMPRLGSVEYKEIKKTRKFDVKIQVSSPIFKSTIEGFTSNIHDIGNSWASRADIAYTYGMSPKQRIVINHKMRDSSINNLKTYSMDR